MGYILHDVFDVTVYDAKSNERLFEVKTALDNRFEILIDTGLGKLQLRDCYFNTDILNKIGNGYYKDRHLRLELDATARESETLMDATVTILVEKAMLTHMSYDSTEKRMMVNNLEFKIVMEDFTGRYKIETTLKEIQEDA